jgi:1-acyl-sn-glycerol-3-phosphate acyltransferase
MNTSWITADSPAAQLEERFSFARNRVRRFWHWVGVCVCGIPALILLGNRVVGRFCVPKSGGVILASNHVSLKDPPLITVALAFRRHVHSMAKDELFHVPLLGRFLAAAGSIRVVRGSGGQAALDAAVAYLRRGHWVLIFPEGRRNTSGSIRAFQSGVIRMALLAQCPIVPVGIQHLGNWKSQISIGQPYSIPFNGDKRRPPVSLLREEAQHLKQKVVELLQQSQAQTV